MAEPAVTMPAREARAAPVHGAGAGPTRGAGSEPAREAAPWPADRVLALAPDASSQRAARGLAGDGAWSEAGRSGPDDGVPPTIWGLARGSGALPYQTVVDVTVPAYRCSCPSRKFPCKHVVGLLLRWSAGAVARGPLPGWVHRWHAERASGAQQTAGVGGGDQRQRPAHAAEPRHGGTPTRQSEQVRARRAERVATGLDELDRWLADQVRAGIAGLAKAGYAPWDEAAARLVDAQAAAVAGVLRRLAAVAGDPDRLLTELALLRLLVEGFRRIEELPGGLADTVRMRVGLPMPASEVLARQPPVRDRWHVVGVRDEQEDHLLVRRAWLRGEATGRPALVLGFAGPGQQLTVDLAAGDRLDAVLCFYPGAQPLRALVAHRYPAPGGTVPGGYPAPGEIVGGRDGAPAGASVAGALREYALALAGDPWLERWPMVLAGVVPVEDAGRWYVAEPDGTGLPIDPVAGEPWPLVAAAGGHPVPLAGEWSAAGLRPLAAWPGGRLVPL